MKNLITIIIFFLPLVILSQVSLKNSSLTNPELPILYKGVDNKIEINFILNDSSVLLKSSFCKVTRSKLNKYIFLVKVSNVSCDTLKLCQNNKLIFKKGFEIMAIPKPVVTFGTSSSSITTKMELFADPVLNVVLPNCYYRHDYKIVSFDLTLIEKGDTIKKYILTKGDKLTGDQIRQISVLYKGSQLFFSNILIKDSISSTTVKENLTIKLDD